MKIYKYPIQIVSEQDIEMPYAAEIIHAGLDPTGQPCIWAVVNPGFDPKPRRIFVVGTGREFETWERHLGSFLQDQFVWHVFQ